VTHQHVRASAGSERTALARALILTALLFAVEVGGGLWSGSLALLADAAHMLTDLLALGLSWLALRLASRPADPRRTFGYYRVEILSAFANGVLLALVAGGVLLESTRRFANPPVVRVDVLAPVAVAGLAANLVSWWWLRGAGDGLPTRAALWHVGSDALGSILVVLTAGVLWFTGWWWMDPVAGLVLAAGVVVGALRLLREAAEVLLESAPPGVDVDEVERLMCGVDGVDSVHDLHVWSLTSGVHALSGHLLVRPDRLGETDRILRAAQRGVRERFDIRHTTLQVESESCGKVVCVLGPES